MDKRLLLFALVALFASPVFAGYTETANVQVLDSQLRPIERAQVYVIYNLNKEYGAFKTPARETDPQGMAKITFTNNEFTIGLVDYKYKVIAQYMNATNEIEVVAGDDHPPVLTVVLPASVLSVTLKDQFGKPVVGTVEAGGIRKDTDGGGYAGLLVAKGSYLLSASALKASKEFLVMVDNDTAKTIVFRTYTPKVKVINDNGIGLQARVEIDNYTISSDSSGIAAFPKTAKMPTSAKIKYSNIVAQKSVNFEVEDTSLVVLDMTPPKISNVRAFYENGIVTLSATIEDFGPFASGFGKDSQFEVDYSVGDNKRKAFMYPLSDKEFQAEIPTLDASSIVYYTIIVTDSEGNSNSASGTYRVEAKVEEKPKVEPPKKDDTMMYAAIGVALGVALLGAYIYKRKKDEEG